MLQKKISFNLHGSFSGNFQPLTHSVQWTKTAATCFPWNNTSLPDFTHPDYSTLAASSVCHREGCQAWWARRCSWAKTPAMLPSRATCWPAAGGLRSARTWGRPPSETWSVITWWQNCTKFLTWRRRRRVFVGREGRQGKARQGKARQGKNILFWGL